MSSSSVHVDRRRLWAGVGRSVSGVHDQLVVYARGDSIVQVRGRDVGVEVVSSVLVESELALGRRPGDLCGWHPGRLLALWTALSCRFSASVSE